MSMGINGYKKLLADRKRMKQYLQDCLQEIANEFHLKVLDTKNNPISVGKKLIINILLICVNDGITLEWSYLVIVAKDNYNES